MLPYFHYIKKFQYWWKVAKSAQVAIIFQSLMHDVMKLLATSGGRLNKKDGLTRYGDSHVKDKTS